MVEARKEDAHGVPFEAVALWLCRDVYHCTPREFDRQWWDAIQAHLEVARGESLAREVREMVNS